MRSQIEAAVLQELLMMAKSTQVTGFGQYCERVNRADARYLLQSLEVGMVT